MIGYIRRQPEFLYVVAVLALVVGGAGAYHVPGLWRRAAAWSQEPRRLTLAELTADRPAGATHVVVTDFECSTHFVYEAQVKKGAPAPKPDQSGFGRAWIPMFERGRGSDGGNEPTGFVVLLDTAPTIESATGKHLLSRLKEMEGIALPAAVADVPSEAREKLLASHPGTRFDECIVLEQADKVRKEDTRVFAYGLTTISGLAPIVGLTSIALGFVLIRRKSRPRGPPPLPRRRRT